MPILFRGVRVEGILVGSVSSFENMTATLSTFRIKPVIDEVFSLDRAQDALAKLTAGTHFGKLVLRIRER
jgi:D-arabinose 1-dehydrogenase-like Zn-dependent alcohol dehydrogenase